jgi:hypothetical protein
MSKVSIDLSPHDWHMLVDLVPKHSEMWEAMMRGAASRQWFRPTADYHVECSFSAANELLQIAKEFYPHGVEPIQMAIKTGKQKQR